MQIRRGKWRGIKIGAEKPRAKLFQTTVGRIVSLLYRDFSTLDSRGREEGRRTVFSGLLCFPRPDVVQRQRERRDGNAKGERPCERSERRARVCNDTNKENRYRAAEEEKDTFVSSISGRKKEPRGERRMEGG